MYQCCFTRAKLGFQTQATNSSNFSLSYLCNIISFLKLGSQCTASNVSNMTTVPPAFVLFWLDLMQCNLNFLHLLQNFQQTTWFSLKKPWSPKTPERRCNSIVSREKKRTLEKALWELCPQNHFLTYFVCEREDEQSQFFDNICRIHSKVIL